MYKVRASGIEEILVAGSCPWCNTRQEEVIMERVKVLDLSPAGFKGGQGRTGEDVEKGARLCFWLVVSTLAALAVMLVLIRFWQ